jgi:hypothetical protein
VYRIKKLKKRPGSNRRTLEPNIAIDDDGDDDNNDDDDDDDNHHHNVTNPGFV